jgi:putative flippase GtrA
VERIRRLSNLTPVRYVFVGGTSFAIEMTSLLTFYYGLHMSLPLATSIAYWIGFVLAFCLQKFVAFRDNRRQLHILTWQAALFALLTFWNWGFALFFVGLFPAAAIIITRSIAQLVFAGWNYFLYKYLIFNEHAGDVWRRLNRDNLLVWSVGLVASWRLLLEIINQIAQYVFNGKLPGLDNLLRWANWDGGWYFNINNIGYTRVPNELGQENIAFFPGFPEMTGTIARIVHLDYITVGLILNVLLTVALVYLLMKLAELLATVCGVAKQKRSIALLSAITLLLFPASFFLAAYYAEAMLVLGFIGAVYFTLRKRLWLAVPFMIIATASKVMGVIVVATVMTIILEQWRRERGGGGNLTKAWAIASLGLSGLLAYMAYLWVRFGDPLLFYHVQQEWGRNGHGFFLSRLFKDYYAHIFNPAHFGGVYGYSINLCWMLTPVVLGVIAFITWRRYKMYWPAVLSGLAMLIPLSTGIPAGLYRYALVAAPIIPFAIIWLRSFRPPVLYGLLAISGLAMFCFAAGFLSGKYFSG